SFHLRTIPNQSSGDLDTEVSGCLAATKNRRAFMLSDSLRLAKMLATRFQDKQKSKCLLLALLLAGTYRFCGICTPHLYNFSKFFAAFLRDENQAAVSR